MPAGELGAVRVSVRPNGQIQADARMRDEAGALRRLKVFRATEQEARAALAAEADAIRYGTLGARLNSRSTVADACLVFLDEKRRGKCVEISTLETYEYSVANVIVPECGDLLLTELTALRCNRLLDRIRDTKSLSAARKARSILSQVCSTGLDHGVLQFNPVRDARALPLPPKKESVLTGGQLATIGGLMRTWRTDDRHHGPRPNVALMENAMWIMVGTSARIGEVLALRRCDVDVTADPPTVLIAATITQTREEGLQRKPAPKRTRQKRRIALPSLTSAAIRQQLANAQLESSGTTSPTDSPTPDASSERSNAPQARHTERPTTGGADAGVDLELPPTTAAEGVAAILAAGLLAVLVTRLEDGPTECYRASTSSRLDDSMQRMAVGDGAHARNR